MLPPGSSLRPHRRAYTTEQHQIRFPELPGACLLPGPVPGQRARAWPGPCL